jgi:hypothetical protein
MPRLFGNAPRFASWHTLSVGPWTGFLPSRPAWDHRAAHNQARWLTEVGRLHPTGESTKAPYVLRGLENGKTQLETLTGGLILEPHTRLFCQDQTFEPPNTYRGLENEKRQKEISSLGEGCCQTFWGRRYPALEICSVPRGGLSFQFFRRPGCTAKLLCYDTAWRIRAPSPRSFIVLHPKYL